MPVTPTPRRISLSTGARQTNLTSQGLLKILRRTNSAIRDDGRWYVDPAVIDQITTARQVLGIDRNNSPSAAAEMNLRQMKENRPVAEHLALSKPDPGSHKIKLPGRPWSAQR